MRDFASLGNKLIDLALRVFHAIQAADKTAFLLDENLPGQSDDTDQISLVGLGFHFDVKKWSIRRSILGSLRIVLDFNELEGPDPPKSSLIRLKGVRVAKHLSLTNSSSSNSRSEFGCRSVKGVTNRLLQITREFKTQLSIYNAAVRHPRTPRLARW
jgi:hypothetical protein